ncbi:MAG: restriction endonuclease [Candidatus Dadabacteria bacterium]|nr:restriction endonuclease [Candidatus Dadabacteria bacterium]MDE0477460.1 restriction endonuclease [Candidatus Dadabacteria bacterium]
MKKPKLTRKRLLQDAKTFSPIYSRKTFPEIYGITDGKAVGTFIEHRFREHLAENYKFKFGSSAKGIDFPELEIDIKVTSIRQPQSSCPYRSARQKIYGLGYSLLVFVYEKIDDHKNKTGRLNFLHTIFVEKEITGDYQTTKGLRNILDNEGNSDDLTAFMYERNLPIDDIQASKIAEEILKKKPEQGYLTISNALQWRLQYGRIIEVAGNVKGVHNLLKSKNE